MSRSNKRKIMVKALSVGMACLVVFLVSKLSLTLYFVMADLMLFTIMIAYYKPENCEFIRKVLWYSILILVSYVGSRVLSEDIDSFNITGRSGVFYVSAGIYVVENIFLIWGRLAFTIYFKKKKSLDSESINYYHLDTEVPEKFFKRREYDLKRLERYISDSEIVGINGYWGTGKTELTKTFRELHKDKCYGITVDVLTCNENELEVFLIGELEKLLSEHHIYSKNARLLKNIMSQQSILKEIRQFIWDDEDFKVKVIDAYKEDIKKLGKPVIICIEDLDRLHDEKIVKKILDFTHRLACQKIRIIYEYDSFRLTKYGIDREYMEKYVPYVVNLTPIPFQDAVEYFKKELKIDPDEYRFLTNKIYTEQYIVEKLGMPREIQIEYYNPPLRKVKTFLKESLLYKNDKNANYNYEKNKKTIIAFLFMKNFWPEIYDKLEFKRECPDELKFVSPDNGNDYTILELLNGIRKNMNTSDKKSGIVTQEEIQRLFRGERNNEKAEIQELNRTKYAIMDRLGYVFQNIDQKYLREKELEEETVSGKKTSKRYDHVYHQPLLNMQFEYKNDKISRLIRNLHSNGLSENTNNEENAKMFIDNVLYATNPKEGWMEYFSRTMHTDYDRDNSTIFRMLGDYDVDMAKALVMYLDNTDEESEERKEDIWLRFIDFRNEDNKFASDVNLITPEYLAFCNYIDTKYRKVFIKEIKCFNRMKVTGNLKDDVIYKDFLGKYFGSIRRHGYVNSIYAERIEYTDGFNNSHKSLVNYLGKFSREIDEKILTGIFVETALDELKELKRFAEKNIEILESEIEAKRKEVKVQTNFRSEPHYTDKETYQRMELLAKNGVKKEEYVAELNCNYEKELLNITEIEELLVKFDD